MRKSAITGIAIAMVLGLMVGTAGALEKRVCEGEWDAPGQLWNIGDCYTPDERVLDVCGPDKSICRVEGYGYWRDKNVFFIKRLTSVRKIQP